LLLLIKDNAHISQHGLAQESHLSSSMVNVYIKELAKEGLIRISGNSNRTIAYHLTHSGKSFLDKHFLEFSAETVQLYAAVKKEFIRILRQYESKGIRTLVLFGASDTGEIVYAAIQYTRMAVLGVIDSDPAKHGKLFRDKIIQPPVYLPEIAPDAVLITSIARQDEIQEQIEKMIPSNINILKLVNL
jgi:predicted transcriptional regulator